METPLDDSGMFWINGSFFSVNSFFPIPFWFNKGSGWTGFFKGATSVVVCTAILLAARRYFKHARRDQLQGREVPDLLSTERTAHRDHSDRRRRLVVTPSTSKTSKFSRHRSHSSEVATVNFVDSDSETDTEVVHKPLDIEIIPVIDEVEVEADDESSELEEDSFRTILLEEDVQDEGVQPSPVGSAAPTARPQSEANISVYSLTFESSSSTSESNLMENQENSEMTATVVMDLGRNGHVPSGFVEEEDKLNSSKRADVMGRGWVHEGVQERGLKVSIEDVRTSIAQGNDSDVVITQAVVSIA